MPLKQSSSKAAIAANIKQLVADGLAPKRAVAAAMRIADKARGNRKGKKEGEGELISEADG